MGTEAGPEASAWRLLDKALREKDLLLKYGLGDSCRGELEVITEDGVKQVGPKN
jgi:hypothetical protein